MKLPVQIDVHPTTGNVTIRLDRKNARLLQLTLDKVYSPNPQSAVSLIRHRIEKGLADLERRGR